MKSLKLYPSTLKGTIKSIPSKSMSHRNIIAASFANENTTISNVLISEDIEATIGILRNLNIKIENLKNGTYIIKGNTFKNLHKDLYANESGSTLRFLIPISWGIEGRHTFVGSSLLGRRSLKVYNDIAKDFDYLIEKKDDNFPIVTEGPIRPGEYVVDGSISSQFVTGLLYILPTLEENSKIIFKNKVASSSYIDLTLKVLNDFGISIKKKNYGYFIKGNQKYKAINSEVEGDFSQAAFFLVAGLLNEEIEITSLNIDSLQGDKEILDIIQSAKGNIKVRNNSIKTFKSDLKATVIDLYNIPDLGPILMVMAAVSEGVSEFRNTNRLIDKESNRLQAMKYNLEKMGVSVVEKDNRAFIRGIKVLEGNFEAKTFNDHRIAMAIAVASSIATGPILLDDYTVVNKSYPTFFKDYIKLGGITDGVK